jgi:hypothetical protein
MIKENLTDDQENKRELDAWKAAHPGAPITDFPYYGEKEWGKDYIKSLENMEESMKITHRQLRQIIKEELSHVVFDDVHVVPDELESLDPYDAYGLGHEAGAGHEDAGPDLDNDGVLGVGEIVRMVHKMVNDLSPEAATVEDAWYPSDVTARKDAWTSGDNLDEPRDYTRFATGESNAGPHVTTRECSEAVEMPQFWSRILKGV